VVRAFNLWCPVPKLLIIDDEANVLYSLQTGLEADDLTVVTAKTGKRGLALVPKENPDVVIVDVRLPDMTGLEVFDRIKEIAPRVPVIVITAFASTETAIEAMKRGEFEACSRSRPSSTRPRRRPTSPAPTRSSAAPPSCRRCTRPSAASPRRT
jgi:CheY-like chemotaxis protein